jgi:hypothetical protein
MGNNKIDIDNFFCPVSTLISTCISSTKLDTFIPLEILCESQSGIDENTELFIVPRVDFPKLEFDE